MLIWISAAAAAVAALAAVGVTVLLFLPDEAKAWVARLVEHLIQIAVSRPPAVGNRTESPLARATRAGDAGPVRRSDSSRPATDGDA